MSARVVELGTCTVKPWQVEHKGRTWRDMPGPHEDEKKLNFFLFRRGLLEAEEIEVEAAADLEESQYLMREDGVRVLRQLRGNKSKHGRVNGLHVARERLRHMHQKRAACEARRAQRVSHAYRRDAMKARLMRWRNQYGACAQIARRAGFAPDFLHHLLLKNTMSAQRLACLEVVMDDLDAGRWEIRAPKVGNVRNAQKMPAGMVSFKLWVNREAERLNIQPTSIYMHLKRHPELTPPVYKPNTRRWYLTEETLRRYWLRPMPRGLAELVCEEVAA